LNSGNRTEKAKDAVTESGLKKACRMSCQKILWHIAKSRQAIFVEASHALESQERLLRLALNEAEALAWQTFFPHLVFPALAMEKVQAVSAWNSHQQNVRRRSLHASMGA
jgi:hypothetical protein